MRSNPNYDVIKEPRGFIKCLEIFLAIFAFACVTGYRGEFQVIQDKSHKAIGEFKYPFSGSIKLNLLNTTEFYLPLDQRTSTEFFVVIGVFCFLYSLAMIIYYIFFEEDNARNAAASSSLLSAPIIDFAFGSFWTLFWFFSACAFAAAVSRINDLTDVKILISKGGSLFPYCNTIHCSYKEASYATLTVAALLGFCNVFVWAGNLWFLWKETPWHNNQNQPPAATVQPPIQQTPQAAAI